MNAPLLAAITLTPKGDGVAVVARLLEHALRLRWPAECAVVSMFDAPARRPSLWDKVSFGIRLNRHLLQQPRWVLFSHIGLTRAMRFVPRPLHRPYAVFLHGTEAWKPLRPADRARLRGAALRLANSKYTALHTMQANPDIGPVVPCPLALPEETGPAQDSNIPLPLPLSDPGARLVVIVGALRSDERYKGHDQLIEAWPAVVAAIPRAHLLIVGDGNDRARVQSLAQGSTVRRAITLLGFAPDALLAACYARAAVFAMPSRGEGFGLVYLEAMAHQLPCIGSRQDAASEVIEDGVTGILVDQHDRPALVAAIVALLGDSDRASAMGRAGRARVQTEFTVPAFQSRLAAALDRAFPAERG